MIIIIGQYHGVLTSGVFVPFTNPLLCYIINVLLFSRDYKGCGLQIFLGPVYKFLIDTSFHERKMAQDDSEP